MRDALNQALKEEMARDPSAFLLGEEVGAYQGAYKVTQGLLAEFGEWRGGDTPPPEGGLAGGGGGGGLLLLPPPGPRSNLSFFFFAPRPHLQPTAPDHPPAARPAR